MNGESRPPLQYRSAAAVLGRVAGWLFGGLLLVCAAVAVADAITTPADNHVGVWVSAGCCAVLAVGALRASRAVLEVTPDSVRVVNWFHTYEFKRSDPMRFVFGDEAIGALDTKTFLFAGNSKHVLLCVADRKINIAALTIGQTSWGAKQVHDFVAELNSLLSTPAPTSA